MTKKPTIAGLQRSLTEVTARADAAERAVREEKRITQQRENQLRDEILDLNTSNARLRGYIDRIEDETPVRPEGRFSRNNEARARNTGRSDVFAMMGGEGSRTSRPWHHR